jgi:serine/threonine-protein kinase ATR
LPFRFSKVSTQPDTAALVSLLLRRLLVKYPAQAMWQIGWTRQSHDAARKKAGTAIFHEAIKILSQNSGTHRLRDLLRTSHTLFSYLAHMASRDSSEGGKTTEPGKSYKVKPLSHEVDLLEYVPPIQAALSISLLEGDSGRSRDIFHRNIPRIRGICPRVDIMASKAKPKKLKTYVIAVEDVAKFRQSRATTDPAQIGQWDIGELHFLLKQEAKGDLRKDARVQDLNNVVNRLLADESDGKSLACRHRISLRTFTVTCLSEDIGLIEW